MSLSLVIGASGAGKTEKIYRDLIASAVAHPDTRHVMLVPEQFTMQTQRQLVRRHPGRGLLNIDVVSFERLANRVFEETGVGRYQILDDTGKSMLLRRSAGEHKKELGIFSRSLSRGGFITRMRSMISELYEYGVDREKLSEMADAVKDRPVLRDKLLDLAVFYRAFSEKLGRRTIPAEEVLPMLVRVLPLSAYLDGAVVAADDFTGFTDMQYQVLTLMIRKCRSLTVSVTLPREESFRAVREGELFALSKTTAKQLVKMAEEAGVPSNVVLLPEDGGLPWRFRENETIARIGEHFLRPGRGKEQTVNPQTPDDQTVAATVQTVSDQTDQTVAKQTTTNIELSRIEEHISIIEARDPAEEVSRAAAAILRLTRQEGLRCRDIAVVVPDLDRYRASIEEEFSACQIPYFMDRKNGLLTNPLIELVRSALQVLLQNFSYDAIFRYLRCGLANIPREGVDLLDNYVHATGMRGASAWQKIWNRKVKGAGDINLDGINALREEVIEPLLQFREQEKGQVKDFTQGIRDLVERLAARDRMEGWAKGFEAEGDRLAAEEYAKAPEALDELLARADELLGEEKMPVREFAEMLDAGINEIKLGAIPQSLDQVQVGDINRSRLTQIKALFFLGMNDDILPARHAGGSILTEEEREVLQSLGLSLAPTARELADQERFYLYRLMTKPSHALWLSYSRFKADGAAARPSRYVGQVSRLFPEIEIIKEDEENAPPKVYSAASARRYFARNAQDLRSGRPSDTWLSLYSVLCAQAMKGGEEGREAEKTLASVLGGIFPKGTERSAQKVADVLYGKVLYGSISQLETFAGCPYSYFLNYGLRLKNRAVHEFDPIDRGNFFHIALETFFSLMKKEGLTLEDVDEETRKKLTEASVLEAIGQSDTGILSENARNRYYVRRWRQMTDRTVWAVIEEMKKTGYSPVGTELFFTGRDLGALRWKLGDKEMILQGRIDRLDICADNGGVAYRVVDYKTGSKDLDLAEIDAGRSLQLPIYLSAAEEILEQENTYGNNLVPSGLYYYQVKDPLISTDSLLPQEELEKNLKKELKLKGLSNEEAGKAGKAVGTREIRSMMRHAQKKAAELGTEILEGQIDAAPLRDGDKTPCDWCAFRSVCRFDPRQPGYHFRRMKRVSNDEIWEIWASEYTDGEDNPRDWTTAETTGVDSAEDYTDIKSTYVNNAENWTTAATTGVENVEDRDDGEEDDRGRKMD